MPMASTNIRLLSKLARTAPTPSPTEDWNCGRDTGRDRRLPASDGLQLLRHPAPRAALRGGGNRLPVALRPPLRTGRSRLSLAGGVDPGDRVAQPHRAHPGRTHGVVQPVPPP